MSCERPSRSAPDTDISVTRHHVATLALAVLTALVMAATGCAGNDSSGSAQADAPTASGVGQSGAQDFGRFRGLVEQGELPAPGTLDSVGFFNEHKFDLPSPDCGEDVCLHGMFGVQGNMIDGSNCSIVAVGFNSGLDAEDFDRPPLNLTVAVDTSGSMQGDPIESVKSGLEKMAGELGPQDRVTVVTYSTDAQVLVESTPADDRGRGQLVDSVRSIRAHGSTDLYAGLEMAFEQVDRHASEERQNRVMLLSDGRASSGIENRQRIVELGKTYAEKSVGLTTIGVGEEFDLELMRQLSENGAGNFYFLEDPEAVEEVFVEEVQTFLVPLAEQVEIELESTNAYRLRAVRGTRNWTAGDREATIDIPALFLAGRESASDTGPGGGRRGGGGIILLELVPTPDTEVLRATPPESKVADITMSYREPDSGETVEQTESVTNPLEPAETSEQGEFSGDTVEKAFVALNAFAGMKMATRRAARGASGAALDILEPLHANVDEWVQNNADEDIEADLELMGQLIEIVDERGGEAERRVGQQPNPWPRD